MTRLLLGVLIGAAWAVLPLAVHAQPEPDEDTVSAAADAGVDPTDLLGAMATTGLEAREYLYQAGELERPYVPPPAARPTGVVAGSSSAPFGLVGYLARVAWCESRYNPGAVGRLGEIGLFQLKPGGMLPVFYRWGGTNPWNGWQQAAFARWAFANGYASRWTCA